MSIRKPREESSRARLLRPLFLGGAALLCFFGIHGVLTRTPSSKAPSAETEALPEVPASVWAKNLPQEPPEGLRPSKGGFSPDAAPERVSLTRSLTLSEGRALTLVLEGISQPKDYSEQSLRFRLESVQVLSGDRPVQTIAFGAPYYQSGGEGGSLWTDSPDFGFCAGDYNFDGAPDFSVTASLWKSGGGSGYRYHFLWEEAENCFVPAPELDVLPSPAFDGEQRLIESFEESRVQLRREVYRYTGEGVLTCVRRRERTLSEESGLLTDQTLERRDGQWIRTAYLEEPASREASENRLVNEGSLRLSLRLTGTEVLQDAGLPPSYRGRLSRIEVRREDGSPEGTLLQTLEFPESNLASDLAHTHFETETPDFNFDSFPDLRVLTNDGTGGFFGRCFLWDPDMRLFVEHEELSWYGAPWPDGETREVCTREENGCTGYVETWFRWEGDDLVPTRQEETVYGQVEDGSYERRPNRRVYREYREGAWEDLKEEELPREVSLYKEP